MSYTEAFNRLVTIMDELREQCPWDKKQTIETLRPLTIEEMYELVDSIAEGDWKGIREELGDLFLHLVFYARIAKEEQQFSLEEVLNGICEKLISRHPHIYGNVQVDDEEDVKRNWEMLKMKEGKSSVLAGVPKGLPALVKAVRMQEKAKKIGFEWENREDVWKKVEEEVKELHEVVDTGDAGKIEDEFGDVLFSLVNYARFIHVDPELALERTNIKFRERFMLMEKIAMERHGDIGNIGLEELDAIWNEVKVSMRNGLAG
ncbi:MAG: nucleoside triphosphate pyrophosphohydrolase [Chitinophagaceae bacterium]|nr:nucleoside triphosphate pyrophosphohydrolase [Chitinophagaceae bacterium]